MGEAFVIDAVRTPVGRHGGALSRVRPDDLAARVIARGGRAQPASTRRRSTRSASGDANQAGEDNRNVARMGLLLAGLPVEVPGVTVNRLCASGLEAVNQAARAIRAGEADLVLAGGVESMSRAPLVHAQDRPRVRPRRCRRSSTPRSAGASSTPALRRCYSTEGMGETAENVAERYEVTRADQDSFALESHRRPWPHATTGRFDREVVSVQTPGARRGETAVVEADEGPRTDTTLESLAKLKPVFREGGTVTAGNASQINDGAACVVLASEDGADRLGKRPLARIVATGGAGVDPAYMGIGPIPASRKALERAGLGIEDMDLVEINEAFAAQVLPCMRELGIPHERLNVNGGAIAIGHPSGASGARLLGTLAWELRERGLRYGLATLCIGVGQGLATVIEAV